MEWNLQTGASTPEAFDTSNALSKSSFQAPAHQRSTKQRPWRGATDDGLFFFVRDSEEGPIASTCRQVPHWAPLDDCTSSSSTAGYFPGVFRIFSTLTREMGVASNCYLHQRPRPGPFDKSTSSNSGDISNQRRAKHAIIHHQNEARFANTFILRSTTKYVLERQRNHKKTAPPLLLSCILYSLTAHEVFTKHRPTTDTRTPQNRQKGTRTEP